MSGWGCDPATGALTTPDKVWEQEIRVCPQAREFRMGTLPHCFELRDIFEGVTVSGDFAVYPGTLTGGHSINLDLFLPCRCLKRGHGKQALALARRVLARRPCDLTEWILLCNLQQRFCYLEWRKSRLLQSRGTAGSKKVARKLSG